tara:strand:+ start:2366 stop:2671 length:306 start_codon:yes stop_codon:yes gene_type:complete
MKKPIRNNTSFETSKPLYAFREELVPNITGGIIIGNTKIVNNKVPFLEFAVSALNATPIKLIVRVTSDMQTRKLRINSNLKPINKNVKLATVIMLKQLVSQ